MKGLKFTIILMLFGAFNALSQTTPIYFNSDGVTNDAKSATSYGVYGKLSDQNLWVLKKFDFDDNLLVSGSYKDELLTQPHGKFVFYNNITEYNNRNFKNFYDRWKDRYISQAGEYVDGLANGVWNNYFPDGTLMHYANYTNGELDGEFRSYSPKGKVIFLGHHKNGIKMGTWYDVDRREKTTYENDQLIRKTRLTREELHGFK